jgi:hypothetical protein
VSRLGIFETGNAIRAWAVAGNSRSSEMQFAIEGLRRAELEGIIVRRSVPERRLFPHATRLSQHHTITRVYGALDILHVATALELSARSFLSFDERQRELATKEGLTVQF